jgi:hypothetical protein
MSGVLDYESECVRVIGFNNLYLKLLQLNAVLSSQAISYVRVRFVLDVFVTVTSSIVSVSHG